MANRPAEQTPAPIPPVDTGTPAPPGPDQADDIRGTAASAPPPDHGSTAWAGSRRPLNGIPEIRHFFRTNTDPVYFIGATAFNLLGLDRWVRNFHYIA